MSRTYAKYGEVKVGVTLSSRINAIIIWVILFIIPTSFMTKYINPQEVIYLEIYKWELIFIA